MNVLGINGSGRPGGNTAVLIRGALEGARAAGAATDLFELGTWDFHGCAGCQGCKETHRCVIQDDMRRFYDVAAVTDLLVVGTAIYLDQVTAQTAAFLQRLYCYLGPDLENHYPNKSARAVVGVTYGASDPHAYRGATDWMAGTLKGYFGIPTLERFAIPEADYRPNIRPDHPEVRRAAAFLSEWVSAEAGRSEKGA